MSGLFCFLFKMNWGKSKKTESSKQDTSSLEWFSSYIASQDQDLVSRKLKSYFFMDNEGNEHDLQDILESSKSEPKEESSYVQDFKSCVSTKYSSPQFYKRPTINSILRNSNNKSTFSRIENPFRKLLKDELKFKQSSS